MDSFLLVIKKIFEINNIQSQFDSYDSLFDDGISFPRLVAISFGIESIPKIYKNPINISQKNFNNDLALRYLCQNNLAIGRISPDINTSLKRKDLISRILRQQMFSMTKEEIISKCNLIIKPLNIQLNRISDFTQFSFLSILLNILTDREDEIAFIINSKELFEEKIIKSFQIAKVPLIIDYSDMKNQQLFLFQIQIILKAFSEKKVSNNINKQSELLSDQIKEDANENQKKSINDLDFVSNDIINQNINRISDLNSDSKVLVNNYDEIGYKEEEEEEVQDPKFEEEDIIEYSSDQIKFSEDEQLEYEALLKTINYLSKIYFSNTFSDFSSFKQTLLNDFIPQFVMRFFNNTIDNVQINSNSNSNILTKQNIKNIYSVINFLKTKENTFEILMFDFYTSYEREPSATLFFKNFLNFFFIKNSKNEMIERLSIFIDDSKTDFRSYNKDIPLYKLLIQSMKLINKRPEEISNELLQINQMIFENFSIPIIFKNIQWNTYFNTHALPDSYFYQLQILFDKWDSNPVNSLIELLLTAKKKFQIIKVPRFDIISSSIFAKRTIMGSNEQSYQNESDDNILNDENISVNKTENKNLLESRYYIERQMASMNEKVNTNYKSNNTEKSNIQFNEDTYNYWYQPSKTYNLYSNGVFYHLPNQIDMVKLDEIKQKMIIPNSTSDSKDQYIVEMFKSHHSIETKLFKIFYYDELKREWIFNAQDFQEFSKVTRINVANVKTPLIFFANSDENDVKILCNHFIFGSYPNLDNENQIFVYALCDKSLTMLNLKNDINDPSKAQTKPIFLLLHVPKNMEKNTHLYSIISQINFFLSTICNILIIILKDNFSRSQLRYIQDILNISKYVEENHNARRIIDNTDFLNTIKNEDDLDLDSKSDTNIEKRNSIIYINCKILNLINIKNLEPNETFVTDLHLKEPFSKMFTNQYHWDEFAFININEIETYRSFFDIFSKFILSDNKMNIQSIEHNFKKISGFEISSIYIKIRNSSDWRMELNHDIQERYLMLSFNKNARDKSIILTNIYNELAHFSSKFDTDYVKKYQEIIYSMRKKESQQNRNTYQNELSKSSKFNIAYNVNHIKSDDYLTEEQMNNIRCNHEEFLANEFYEMVKFTCSESVFYMAFEDNYDLVSTQISLDRKYYNDFFKKFQEKIDMRKAYIEKNTQDSIKEGTNYMLKETENLREVKVAIEINKDLTSIIDQDF